MARRRRLSKKNPDLGLTVKEAGAALVVGAALAWGINKVSVEFLDGEDLLTPTAMGLGAGAVLYGLGVVAGANKQAWPAAITG